MSIIIWIWGKIGHGKRRKLDGKDFWGGEKSLNASNVKTMASIKTDGNKCGPLWINHCCKISFRGSKSHLPQTNDRVRGLTTGSTISWNNTVWWRRRYDGGGGGGGSFPLCNADHRLIVLTNGANFWARYSQKHPFHSYPFPPGASREELLLNHCGLSGRIPRPTHLLSRWRGSYNCELSRQTMKYRHTARKRVNSNTNCLSGCILCHPMSVCCSPPPPPPPLPHPRIIFVHLPAHADGTFQKRLLCNLSQFSKSINFLCVACLSSSPDL